MIKLRFLGLLLLSPLAAFSLETRPWIGNLFEIEAHASGYFQNIHHVDTPHKDFKYTSNDQFITLGAGVAIAEDFALEIEGTGAHTRRQAADLDNLRLGVRYVIFDDIAGDWATLTTGLTIIKAFDTALKDISSFHHGKLEGEWTISLGNEIAHGETWSSRGWSYIAIGLGDHGSPWLRANASWENRFCSRHLGRIFANTLWGLGHNNIRGRHDFHGYGPIRHQSVDVGARYTYENEYFGSLALEYFYRPYACNFPAHVHGVMAFVEISLAL